MNSFSRSLSLCTKIYLSAYHYIRVLLNIYICSLYQDAMVVLGQGALEGVHECQHQFRNHRWNCSTLDRDASVFGKVLLKGESRIIIVYII